MAQTSEEVRSPPRSSTWRESAILLREKGRQISFLKDSRNRSFDATPQMEVKTARKPLSGLTDRQLFDEGAGDVANGDMAFLDALRIE